MSSFRNQSGVDLDLVFASRVTSPTSNTNFRNTDSVDLANRYEKANATAPTSAVGMRGPDGRDLCLWFTTNATGGLAVNVASNDISYDNGLSTQPATRSMQAGASSSASGGTGSYSYYWEIINTAGVLAASLTSTAGPTTTINATVSLNIVGSVTVRCTVNDGVNSVSGTSTSTFDYYNNI